MSQLEGPIIIFGTGRCGSSILSEIVFRHPDLAFPSNYNEFFPRVREVSLIRHLFDNRWWNKVGAKPQSGKSNTLHNLIFQPGESYSMWKSLCGDEVDFIRGFLLEEQLSEQRKEKMRVFFCDMVRLQGRERLAFKITGPSRLRFLHSVFPGAHFVRMTREPLDTIHSWLKVDFWKTRGLSHLWWNGVYTPEQLDWVRSHAEQPHMVAALQYKMLMEIADREISETPVQIHTLAYEDFRDQPMNEVSRVLEFCGLDEDPRVEAYVRDRIVYKKKVPDHDLFSVREIEDIKGVLNRSIL